MLLLFSMSYNNKVIKFYGKINLKDYITSLLTMKKIKKMKIASSLKSLKNETLILS